MNISDLHKQIVTNKVDPFLILTGAEVGILDIYLKRICETSDRSIEYCETVQDAYRKMVVQSMSSQSRLFIVRGDDPFLKLEKNWSSVMSSVSLSNSLILVFSQIDKRGKFYKQYADKIVEFEALSPAMLCKYVDNELVNVSNDDKMNLIELCESNYSRIMLECDKIRQYTEACRAMGKHESHTSALRTLISDGTIFAPIGDITFKLTDAILLRRPSDVGKYLLQARSKGEPEIMILSILYNSFKQILMVQGLGPDKSDACKRTGLTPWQVKMAKEKMGSYDLEELVFALKTTRFAEMGIKTGQLDAEISLEYLVANIL